MRNAIDGLNLKALRAFMLVCETKSMTDAARTLGVTPSAISQLVGSLEQDQGVSLFDRRFRPARLSPAGIALLDQAESLLAHAQAVSRNVRAAVTSEVAALRIGAINTFSCAVAPVLLDRLQGDYHDIGIESGPAGLLLEKLAGREIDVAICDTSPPEHRHFQGERLFGETFVLAVPRALAAGQTFRNLCSVVDRFPLLRYSPRSELGAQIERYITHIGLTAPRRFELDLTAPLIALVAQGLGCAVTTPLCLWQSLQYLDNIALVPMSDSHYCRREFFVVSRRDESATQVAAVRRAISRDVTDELRHALALRLAGLPEHLFNWPEPAA